MERDLYKNLEINSNIWIEANAGSGKTTKLIQKYLSLILKEENLKCILCLSYTNVACIEIKERILNKIKYLINLSDNINEEKNNNIIIKEFENIFCLEISLIKEQIFQFNDKTLAEFLNFLFIRLKNIYNNFVSGKDYFAIHTIHSFCYKEIILKTKYQNRQIFTEKDKYLFTKDIKNNLLKYEKKNEDLFINLNKIFDKKNSKKIFDDILDFSIKYFLSLEKKYLTFNKTIEDNKFNFIKNYPLFEYKYLSFLQEINISYLILNINNDILIYLISNINLLTLIINNLRKNLTHVKNGNLHLCLDKISKFNISEKKNIEEKDINFIMNVLFETFFTDSEENLHIIADKIYDIYLKEGFQNNTNDNIDIENILNHEKEYLRNFINLKDSISSMIDKKFEKEKEDISRLCIHLLLLFSILNEINNSQILYCYNNAIALVIKEFRRYLNEKMLISFDEILDLSNTILSNENELKLFEIDSRLKHILLDEAQDFNEISWQIIDKISKEFFYGYSSFDGDFRTIFCVGDTKQSIFSFQGAKPEYFYIYKNYFEKKSLESDVNFINQSLSLSYRCSDKILNIIDNICNQNRYNSAFFSQKSFHQGVKRDNNIFIIQQIKFNNIKEYFLPTDINGEEQKTKDKTDWLYNNLNINFNKNKDINIREETDDLFYFYIIEDKINNYISRLQKNNNKEKKNIGILFRNKNINNKLFYKLFDFLKEKNFNVEISSSNYISIDEMDILMMLSFLEGNFDKLDIISILKNNIFNLSDVDIKKFSNKKDILKFILEYKDIDMKLNNSFIIFNMLYDIMIKKISFFKKILYLFSFFKNCFSKNYIDKNIYLKYTNSLHKIFNTSYQDILTFKINNVKDLKDYLRLNFKNEIANNIYQANEANQYTITLSTIHSSKGREYDEVYIFDDFSNKKDNPILTLDLNLGEISFARDHLKENEKEFNEEMRLFYVVMTRSKGNIYLIKRNIIEQKDFIKIFPEDIKDDLNFLQYLQDKNEEDNILNIKYQNKYIINIDSNITINLLHILNDKISYLEKDVKSATSVNDFYNQDDYFEHTTVLSVVNSKKIFSYSDIFNYD